MAKIVGTLPEAPRPSLLGALAGAVSPAARMKVEMEQGEGLRRLLPVLERLPDHMTVVIRPALGFFMRAECCVVGPDRVIVLATLHWPGKVTKGERDEWLGARSVDLGRPDRRALYFAERIEYGDLRGDRAVEALVVCTAGETDLTGVAPLTPVMTLEEAEAYLQRMGEEASHVSDDAAGLIKALSS